MCNTLPLVKDKFTKEETGLEKVLSCCYLTLPHLPSLQTISADLLVLDGLFVPLFSVHNSIIFVEQGLKLPSKY
jgi:hypothetical protein